MSPRTMIGAALAGLGLWAWIFLVVDLAGRLVSLLGLSPIQLFGFGLVFVSIGFLVISREG